MADVAPPAAVADRPRRPGQRPDVGVVQLGRIVHHQHHRLFPHPPQRHLPVGFQHRLVRHPLARQQLVQPRQVRRRPHLLRHRPSGWRQHPPGAGRQTPGAGLVPQLCRHEVLLRPPPRLTRPGGEHGQGLRLRRRRLRLPHRHLPGSRPAQPPAPAPPSPGNQPPRRHCTTQTQATTPLAPTDADIRQKVDITSGATPVLQRAAGAALWDREPHERTGHARPTRLHFPPRPVQYRPSWSPPCSRCTATAG